MGESRIGWANLEATMVASTVNIFKMTAVVLLSSAVTTAPFMSGGQNIRGDLSRFNQVSLQINLNVN